jgi:hypothetical protein
VDLGLPSSYLALEPGTDVVSSDGERVGKVEHVLAADEEDIFDGLVIDIETGPGGLRFADSEQVDEIYERGCVLNVPAAEIDDLPRPAPQPAAMEAHADDVDSSLAAKLHRAWDRISGNY